MFFGVDDDCEGNRDDGEFILVEQKKPSFQEVQRASLDRMFPKERRRLLRWSIFVVAIWGMLIYKVMFDEKVQVLSILERCSVVCYDNDYPTRHLEQCLQLGK